MPFAEDQVREALEDLDSLRIAVERALPAYQIDGEVGQIANHEERIDTAGAEIVALRAYYTAMHSSPTPELVAQLEEEIDALIARS